MTKTSGLKIISGLLLAILVAGVTTAYGKSSIITFTGKIQEIRKATSLDLGKSERFVTIKLDTKPHIEFRLSSDDAVRYGLIDAGSTSQVVLPKHNKGLGWTVKVTCSNEPIGPTDAPVYQVKSLERIAD
jgi:hypothetical protein